MRTTQRRILYHRLMSPLSSLSAWITLLKRILFRLISIVNWALTGLLLGLIQLYRWFLSPFIGRQCRFQPTCSVYAQDALKQYGVIKGVTLTINRLRRCHPFKTLGASDGYVYDPVPLPPSPIRHAPPFNPHD
jgi:putative membrane protein insertion efficiency factor